MAPTARVLDASALRVDRFRGESSEWDAFVRDREEWTHFQLFGWKEIIERVFGHECIYLCARSGGGDLAGVLPLVRVRSRLFGHFLVSMPFVNYGGPLGTTAAVRQLAAEASDLARASGVKLLELRSRRPLDIDLAVSHRKVTVVLGLPTGDAEALWKDLKAKVRSQVRRPRKEGVRVRFGPDQLEPFFAVFATHMRDLGTPTQSRRFFQTIAEVFPNDVWFGCAYLRGEPIAAGCALRWADEVEMTWASALKEYNRIAPNMLLYWSFMERAIEEGVTLFNFGRCTPGGGTHRFKSQWGGRDEPLWWYQRSEEGVSSTPSPEDGIYSWGTKLWQRLPVNVTNALGPRIVGYIP